MRHLLSLTLSAFVATSAFALTEEIVDKKLPASPGGKIVVQVEFGTIEVTGSDTSEVTLNATRTINASSEAKEREYVEAVPITFIKEGNTITLRARSEKKSNGGFWNWFGGGRTQTKARYTLKVPTKFSAALDTAGGAISVSDLTGDVHTDTSGGALRFSQIRGPIKGDTSGGAIVLSDCEGTIKVDTSGGKIEVSNSRGSLRADTSGGSISVTNFGGDATVETSGGGLKLQGIKGSVRGETSGGSITATLVAPLAGDVKLGTSGGSIEVRIPAGAALDLDAATGSGRVTTDFEVVTTARKETDRVRGSINGGGKTVRLRNSSGGIAVVAMR